MSLRWTGALLLVAGLLLAGVSAAEDEKDKPRIDPEKAFRQGDKDKDGKLSRDEFRALVRNAPRLKDDPNRIDMLFDRLDADGDGTLSASEFKAIAGFAADKPKEKPAAPPSKVEEKPATAEGVAFFEKKIRPVLVAECYQCHDSGKGKVKGRLALDTRDGLRKGGESGVVIVPGHPEQSLLVKALKHADEHLQMPPKKKLDAAIVADFERWVRMGAPDPRDGTPVARNVIDVEKGREFWSFRPPVKTEAPRVKDTAWPRTDVDRFLQAALEARGLRPVGDADRAKLIRRVTFDLIGLPPTPEEVEAFVKDTSPEALAKVVDRLLSSKHFGERWGRHWLDVARYAESSGKEVNFSYPHAWRYRDYVIKSFNDDKPYDRFVREQVAGDLLPAADAKQQAEQLIATGFLAVGTKPHNERSRTQFEMDVVDEQIDTLSQAVLGLTIACARCHDHKFDPIPMRDYYAMAGIFRSTTTHYGTIRVIQNNHPSTLIRLPEGSDQPAGLEKLSKMRRSGLERQIASLREQRQKMRKDGKRFSIQSIFLNSRMVTVQAQLDLYDSEGNPKRQAMGVRDRRLGVNSPLFTGGEVSRPGERIPRGFLRVVNATPPRVGRGSGRRELADWLTKDNPLTARVMVNRVWLHLFGRAIVPTPDNFGTMGQRPSNQPLLDHLAVWFQENGWSVKKLIRHLVLSRAYQLASSHDAKCHDLDPDNALVWRMSKRRLEAEPLRDAMLVVSGQLRANPPEGSLVSRGGEGRALGFFRRGLDDPFANHRSVYLPVIRDTDADAMALFDFADPSMVVGERSVTTVPSQALYLLNNSFVMRQAEVTASRLLGEMGSDRDRIQQAYLRFYSRPPSVKEVNTAEAFLESYPEALARDGVPEARRRQVTWAGLCHALFASAEFQYRD